MLKKLLFTGIIAFTFVSVNAQDGAPANWFNLDKEQDGVPGVSTEKTYENLLKGKTSVSVVVAVADEIVESDLQLLITESSFDSFCEVVGKNANVNPLPNFELLPRVVR